MTAKAKTEKSEPTEMKPGKLYSITTEQAKDPELAMRHDLAELQGDLECVARGGEGQEGHRTYSYATPEDIANALRPLLAQHGFSVTHKVVENEPSKYVLRTTVMHRLGADLEGDLPIDLSGRTKERGSELTYARRYNLCLVLNVTPEEEDDEGDAANKRPPMGQGQDQQRPPAQQQQRQNGNGSQQGDTKPPLKLTFTDPETGEVTQEEVPRNQRALRLAIARIEAGAKVDPAAWEANKPALRAVYHELPSIQVDSELCRGQVSIHQWCETMEATYGPEAGDRT